MADGLQYSSPTARPTRVLVLGKVTNDSWLLKIAKQSPIAAEISWADIDDPDHALGAFVRAGIDADVVIVGFDPDQQALVKSQRWVWLASELGVRHLVITVDRSNLPPEGRKGFDALLNPLLAFVRNRCGFHAVSAVPVTSATGGNIVERDQHLGWYMGPTLIEVVTRALESGVGDDAREADHPPFLSDHVQARIVWVGPDPLIPWRPLRLVTKRDDREATVTTIKYELDAYTDQRIQRNRLRTGAIGVCNINTTKPFACASFSADRKYGVVTLIDPATDLVVGFGLIDFSLRRASNVQWQKTTITPNERAHQKRQKACVLWFTGLSGSGKSTIADKVEKHLNALGRHTMLLDGDNVRHGLNKDLGFTDVDRVENIRRISEVSKLMCDAGLIVLVSFISPFQAERKLARETIASHDFHEIYVSTPLEVAEQRDVKGLYAKARRGEIKNFTGIDSPYEPPENPEMIVDTVNETAEQAATRIIKDLLKV